VNTQEHLQAAILANKNYICNEVLADDIVFENRSGAFVTDLEIEGDTQIDLVKN
jgi:hypothetical protein